MTALLELKQRIKNLYSQYEIYILPVLRFVLAMVYFIWINTNMGYMKQIDNIFIVLILALICSILPSGVMIFVGFALMVAHGYALGIEVAGFMLVLILFMAILFLRFSKEFIIQQYLIIFKTDKFCRSNSGEIGKAIIDTDKNRCQIKNSEQNYCRHNHDNFCVFFT